MESLFGCRKVGKKNGEKELSAHITRRDLIIGVFLETRRSCCALQKVNIELVLVVTSQKKSLIIHIVTHFLTRYCPLCLNVKYLEETEPSFAPQQTENKTFLSFFCFH